MKLLCTRLAKTIVCNCTLRRAYVFKLEGEEANGVMFVFSKRELIHKQDKKERNCKH